MGCAPPESRSPGKMDFFKQFCPPNTFLVESNKHVSGGANYLPKFLTISFFKRVSLFLGVFGTFGPPIREIFVYTGMLPCLVPSWPQIMQLRISFRSRSDLGLDADPMPWIFLSDLAFQACISFYSVLGRSGA